MFVQIMVRSVNFYLLTNNNYGELMVGGGGEFCRFAIIIWGVYKNIYWKLSCSLARSSTIVNCVYAVFFGG